MAASVFISAFLAATILPAQSEAVLGVQISLSPQDTVWLVILASAGNVLGATVNWGLGRYAHSFRTRRWFPANSSQLDRAERAYRRYGRYSLLLSWVPVIGDPLTVIAGLMREPILSFLVIVSIAKTARYILLALAVHELV